MTSPPPVTTLFYGQDEPALRDRLAEFCAQVTEPATAALNTIHFDGRTAELTEIQAAAATLPFLAEARLVLVDSLTEANAGKGLLDALPETIAGLPDWARLVLIESGIGLPAPRHEASPRQKALKKLISVVENDPRGRVIAFDFPQSLRDWLVNRAAAHGAQIESPAAQLLAQRIGEDLTLADSELAKLAAFTNCERPIQAEDVKLLTPYTPEASIFEMVDAMGQRDGQRALRLLRQLLESGDEPLRVFGMIVRQYRMLIQMREYLDRGGRPHQAWQVLGLNEFVARKIAEQARHYSLRLLERIYRRLLETDLAMKGGMETPWHIDRLDPALALEDLIARLSTRS